MNLRIKVPTAAVTVLMPTNIGSERAEYSVLSRRIHRNHCCIILARIVRRLKSVCNFALFFLLFNPLVLESGFSVLSKILNEYLLFSLISKMEAIPCKLHKVRRARKAHSFWIVPQSRISMLLELMRFKKCTKMPTNWECC